MNVSDQDYANRERSAGGCAPGDIVISADAGGTFLDLLVVARGGQIGVGKALHTPQTPEIGVLNAIEGAAAAMGLTAREVIERCKLVLHGTTVTTNGLIERKGVRTGLICTKGFEDTLYIGRVRARTEGLDQYRLSQYTRLDRSPAIVPSCLIHGLAERIDSRGVVIAPLDLGEVDAAAEALVQAGVDAIAIAFLHSYANQHHEQAAKRRIAERYPSLDVVLSSEIAPIIGEFERTNTAVLNAYLNPLLERHLENLGAALATQGYGRDVLIMQSIGGVSSSVKIRSESVKTLLSGPVGGIVGAQKIATLIGEKNIVTTDMGGTSFDVGVIVNGRPEYSTQPVIHQQVVAVPAVNVETIGAGGGSRVWIDANDNLQVGPESVGARPGPACYDQGGVVPTVTDADVVLGFLDPNSFSLNGRAASRDAAIAAFERTVCEKLGMTPVEAADAVLQIVNNRMADLVRKATVERGHDPRDFVILAFGGSGPTHCTAYGAEIGAKKIVVPRYASVFSAYGIAQADIKHSLMRSVLVLLPQHESVMDETLARLNDGFSGLVPDVESRRTEASAQGGAAILSYALDCRFKGQSTEITVPVMRLPLAPVELRSIVAQFKTLYDMSYGAGASSPTSPIEFVNVRAEITVPSGSQLEPTAATAVATTPVSAAMKGRRPVYWGRSCGWADTPVYDVERLGFGHEVRGPALVELFKSTAPIYEGQRATVDAYRNLVIESAC